MTRRNSDKFLNSVKERNKKTIEYIDKLNNIKYLYQRDFSEGTYRITKPGKYKLYENIVFHPNANNGFKPRNDQSNKYPRGGYVLGFFAVITIEAPNVSLDLNKYRISVSEEFNQNQRFASIIECGNSPFLTKQGPANFGEFNSPPSNITIFNGHIGLSPHHGIRANKNNGVVLRNLSIDNFEVAAISLHGCKNVLIDNVNILGTSRNVYSLSKYSQSLFILPFLEKIIEKDKYFVFKNRYAGEYYNDLLDEIERFQKYIFYKKDYNGLFKNETKQADGNSYGILLHTSGIATGKMMEERTEESEGNENITIRNCKIKNIISQSVEILGIKNDKRLMEKSYVGKLMTGPVGDVFSLSNTFDKNDNYKGDLLNDVQLLIAKRKLENIDGEKYGSTSITKDIINWAENNSSFQFLKNIYVEDGHDSMGHVMKGNHGILISCGRNINLSNITIENVENLSKDNISDLSKLSCGICTTGSEIINGRNIKIRNIKSTFGESHAILKKNTNKEINFK